MGTEWERVARRGLEAGPLGRYHGIETELGEDRIGVREMGMEDGRRACEFQLLKYVPDPVRNEYVHIGVILREQGSPGAEVRFTRDWRRVRCLDPDADT